ncbi:MAG: hypothetical protein A4E65_02809 [Syntrophorhabdus sp. PtaU1.Bin153]|nr:MAG: hypothetical protein A4E65_02809 [Syntrophorhabdus sp. PtaU1.Bin153]
MRLSEISAAYLLVSVMSGVKPDTLLQYQRILEENPGPLVPDPV